MADKIKRGLFSDIPGISLETWKVNECAVELLPANGERKRLEKGMLLGEWSLTWIGIALERPCAVLEQTTPDGGGYLILFDENEGYYIRKPRPGAYERIGNRAEYMGRNLTDVLASGRDILGEEILQEGEASYESVVDVLPPIKTGRYAILGSPTSWGKLIVMPNGDIVTHDTWAASGGVTQVFRVSENYGYLTGIIPSQGLMDEWMPIIVSRFEEEEKLVEITAFVVPGETGRDPAARVRICEFPKKGGAAKSTQILRLKRSAGSVQWDAVADDKFYEQFISAVLYWFRFKDKIAVLEVPEFNVSRWLIGCMAMAATVFSGDHPHYGGRGYAPEFHDLFPPNFLTSVETYFLMGDTVRARRILEHLLAHGIDEAGRFTYWQGNDEQFAASGTEYGQLLWLLDRVENKVGPSGWLEPYLDTLEKIGTYIIRRRMEAEEVGSKRLVLLCAEADNDDRVYPYLGNNLWAVRGLWALGRLMTRYGRPGVGLTFKQEGDDLFQTLKEALEEYQESSMYGSMVPFRFGYPAVPWTLSRCQVCPDGVELDSFEEYLNSWSWGRAAGGSVREGRMQNQDFLENTYANYRYYPEALSAALLTPEQSDAIVELRRDRGGEALGMCRFRHGIDEWPGSNYARFLLETDRIDSYLLLYYSHMCHHGLRDVLTYYEQVTLDGAIMAPDCIPSLLLVPMMTAWMFCFEPVGEDALYLCRAVPRRWFRAGEKFSVKGLMTSLGPISLEVRVIAEVVEATIQLPAETKNYSIYVDFRLPDSQMIKKVVAGNSVVEEIIGPSRLKLKRGTGGTIKLSCEASKCG